MPDYTFHTLSPIDFENLVRDLLQSELSIRLESFKTGKDGGIDLRYSKADGPSLIVQAKHFADSGLRGLLSHLRSKEKPKIDSLQPERYLLATSVPLSPANKDEIGKTLSPYIKDPKDIYGKEDLNHLLGLFPDVERQHFKLWLSSTTVLEEVLHSRIINQTRITLQDISDKARLYVVNESFNKALGILRDYNYVIIAGIPGIGKTTLAKIVALHFLQANYDFIDVSYDISEAYSIPDHHRPRVYLYDDFFGRTFLAEKLRKNEDHRLLNFIAAVRNTKSAKLILTTREYLLRQAQATYEILNGPIFEKPQCIVDLSQYTRPIRAQILYNHLYFSTLPREHVEAIIQQEAYLKIIDHPNYNPRIVEYMTDPMWVGCDQSIHYPAVFLRNLQEPFLIWEQAFSNHLTNTAQETLLVLGTLPRETFTEDLELAAKRFVSRRGPEIPEKELRRALSELPGNFIVLKQDRGNDIVSFHNPSVQDFVDRHLERNPDLYEALGKAACFFEQIQWLCEKAMTKGLVRQMTAVLLARLQEALPARPCTLINSSSDRGQSTHKGRGFLKHVARLIFVASLLQKSEFDFLEDMFRKALKHLIDQMSDLGLSNDDLLRLVKKVIDLSCVIDLRSDFLAVAKESFYRNADWISDGSCLVEFLELCPKVSGSEDKDRVVQTIDDIVDNLDDNDPQLLSDELSSLEEIERKSGLSLQKQIESVRCLFSRAEENCPPEEDYDNDRYRGSSTSGQSIGNDAHCLNVYSR
jgi:hypothetical protein